MSVESKVSEAIKNFCNRHNLPYSNDDAIVSDRTDKERKRTEEKEIAFWKKVKENTKFEVAFIPVTDEQMKELDKDFEGKKPVEYWDEMKFQKG